MPRASGQRSPLAHRLRGLGKDLVLLFIAATGIALFARLAVPLPFSPVPVTGQTLAVLVTGGLLGSVRGVLAIALYLLAGSLGLPVFADGESGIDRLSGPTGGYLAGFAAAAGLAGWLPANGWRQPKLRLFAAMLLAHAAIFVCGVAWLARFIGLGAAVTKGLVPFLLGALIKSALAALILLWQPTYLTKLPASPDKDFSS